MQFFNRSSYAWFGTLNLEPQQFICGFCSNKVASEKGYAISLPRINNPTERIGSIYLCPSCEGPSFFTPQRTVYPSPALGRPVKAVPEELNSLYEEARRCTSQNCYTAAVLLCRKMLMNISVQQGAEKGLKFIEYVNYLSGQGYVPPNGKHWVDHIRLKGNEATHEIAIMNEKDAQELLLFTEMLLKFIYEFPNMVQLPSS